MLSAKVWRGASDGGADGAGGAIGEAKGADGDAGGGEAGELDAADWLAELRATDESARRSAEAGDAQARTATAAALERRLLARRRRRQLAAVPAAGGAGPEAEQPAGAYERMLGLDAVPTGDTAVVSEAFARRFGVARGDTLRLPVGTQPLVLRVGAVWTDYAYDGGRVLVDFERLAVALGDARAEGLALYLAAPQQAEAVSARLQARYAGSPGIRLTPSAALRAQALAAFDRTFEGLAEELASRTTLAGCCTG